MIRTGIFGGSFNPIHKGHISLAQQLRKRAELDEVWLMVSPQNPLKQSADLLDDNLRMEMHLPKPSYTWNTLQALSKDYPDREFVLLMGGDNWALFNRWYHHEDIAANYQIFVYDRTPGEPGFIDISSTEIRERIKTGKGIKRLVPKVVADFIKERGVFRGKT